MTFHPFNMIYPADYFANRGDKNLAKNPIRNTNRNSQPQNQSLADSSKSEQNKIQNSTNIQAKKNNSHEMIAKIEAVLFVSREPLSTRRIMQLANLPEGTKLRPLLLKLNELYDKRQSAFRVIEVAGGFQLRTRPEFAAWLVRIQEVPATIRLSTPAMETLTIIAYQQPIPRANIEKLRGVQCGDLIRQLLDHDLVKITGRSDDLGRPFLYGTTKNFLQVFGLGSINDLPR
jgi:segregation and condensation protein B